MFSKPEENIRCRFENHFEPDTGYTHIPLCTKCMLEYYVKQLKIKIKSFQSSQREKRYIIFKE